MLKSHAIEGRDFTWGGGIRTRTYMYVQHLSGLYVPYVARIRTYGAHMQLAMGGQKGQNFKKN